MEDFDIQEQVAYDDLEVTAVKNLVSLLLKSLDCPICLDLLNDPVCTTCHHVFCRKCIKTVLQSKFKAPCPLCVTPITKRCLREKPKFREILQTVKEVAQAVKNDCGLDVSPPKRFLVDSSSPEGRSSMFAFQLAHPSPQKPFQKQQGSNFHMFNSDAKFQEKNMRTEVLIDEENITSAIKRNSSNTNIFPGFPSKKTRKYDRIKKSHNSIESYFTHNSEKRPVSCSESSSNRKETRKDCHDTEIFLSKPVDIPCDGIETKADMLTTSSKVGSSTFLPEKCNGSHDTCIIGDIERSVVSVSQSSTNFNKPFVAIENNEKSAKPFDDKCCKQNSEEQQEFPKNSLDIEIVEIFKEEHPETDTEQPNRSEKKLDCSSKIIFQSRNNENLEPDKLGKNSSEVVVFKAEYPETDTVQLGKNEKKLDCSTKRIFKSRNNENSEPEKLSVFPLKEEDPDPYQFIASQRTPKRSKKRRRKRKAVEPNQGIHNNLKTFLLSEKKSRQSPPERPLKEIKENWIDKKQFFQQDSLEDFAEGNFVKRLSKNASKCTEGDDVFLFSTPAVNTQEYLVPVHPQRSPETTESRKSSKAKKKTLSSIKRRSIKTKFSKQNEDDIIDIVNELAKSEEHELTVVHENLGAKILEDRSTCSTDIHIMEVAKEPQRNWVTVENEKSISTPVNSLDSDSSDTEPLPFMNRENFEHSFEKEKSVSSFSAKPTECCDFKTEKLHNISMNKEPCDSVTLNDVCSKPATKLQTEKTDNCAKPEIGFINNRLSLNGMSSGKHTGNACDFDKTGEDLEPTQPLYSKRYDMSEPSPENHLLTSECCHEVKTNCLEGLHMSLPNIKVCPSPQMPVLELEQAVKDTNCSAKDLNIEENHEVILKPLLNCKKEVASLPENFNCSPHQCNENKWKSQKLSKIDSKSPECDLVCSQSDSNKKRSQTTENEGPILKVCIGERKLDLSEGNEPNKINSVHRLTWGEQLSKNSVFTNSKMYDLESKEKPISSVSGQNDLAKTSTMNHFTKEDGGISSNNLCSNLPEKTQGEKREPCCETGIEPVASLTRKANPEICITLSTGDERDRHGQLNIKLILKDQSRNPEACITGSLTSVGCPSCNSALNISLKDIHLVLSSSNDSAGKVGELHLKIANSGLPSSAQGNKNDDVKTVFNQTSQLGQDFNTTSLEHNSLKVNSKPPEPVLTNKEIPTMPETSQTNEKPLNNNSASSLESDWGSILSHCSKAAKEPNGMVVDSKEIDKACSALNKENSTVIQKGLQKSSLSAPESDWGGFTSRLSSLISEWPKTNSQESKTQVQIGENVNKASASSNGSDNDENGCKELNNEDRVGIEETECDCINDFPSETTEVERDVELDSPNNVRRDIFVGAESPSQRSTSSSSDGNLWSSREDERYSYCDEIQNTNNYDEDIFASISSSSFDTDEIDSKTDDRHHFALDSPKKLQQKNSSKTSKHSPYYLSSYEAFEDDNRFIKLSDGFSDLGEDDIELNFRKIAEKQKSMMGIDYSAISIPKSSTSDGVKPAGVTKMMFPSSSSGSGGCTVVFASADGSSNSKDTQTKSKPKTFRRIRTLSDSSSEPEILSPMLDTVIENKKPVKEYIEIASQSDCEEMRPSQAMKRVLDNIQADLNCKGSSTKVAEHELFKDDTEHSSPLCPDYLTEMELHSAFSTEPCDLNSQAKDELIAEIENIKMQLDHLKEKQQHSNNNPDANPMDIMEAESEDAIPPTPEPPRSFKNNTKANILSFR